MKFIDLGALYTEYGIFRPGRDADTPADLHRLIGETLEAIDQSRESWTGWRQSLTQEQRDRLRELEAEVDAAALAGDRRRLVEALDSFKELVGGCHVTRN